MLAQALMAGLVAAGHYNYRLVTFGQVLSHSNVCVVGRVDYVRHQSLDKDWHITLGNDQGQKLVTEIIPELPLSVPRKGQRILACGISRPDDHHEWNEIHPLTFWKER